ncbi:MAG: SH3 domain-containing protein [Gemmatimonadaceae bacterium]
MAARSAAVVAPLTAALADLTAGGRVAPRISIDAEGVIRVRGSEIARLDKHGNIMVRERVIGRVANGRIWEVLPEGGIGRAVGRIVGRVRGTSGSIFSEPTGQASLLRTLRSGTTVELLQVRGNWYHVRLLDGSTGWVWAALLVLTTVFDPEAVSDSTVLSMSRAPSGHVTLVTGEAFWLRDVTVTLSAVRGSTLDGRAFAVDRELIRWFEASQSPIEVDWTREGKLVRLKSGAIFVADRCAIRNDVAWLMLLGTSWMSMGLEEGSTIPVDTALVQSGCQRD